MKRNPKAMRAGKAPTVIAALMEAARLGALEIPRAREYPEPASGFAHTDVPR